MKSSESEWTDMSNGCKTICMVIYIDFFFFIWNQVHFFKSSFYGLIFLPSFLPLKAQFFRSKLVFLWGGAALPRLGVCFSERIEAKKVVWEEERRRWKFQIVFERWRMFLWAAFKFILESLFISLWPVQSSKFYSEYSEACGEKNLPDNQKMNCCWGLFFWLIYLNSSYVTREHRWHVKQLACSVSPLYLLQSNSHQPNYLTTRKFFA